VVIDDKLGIAAELEARCSTWSDTYECEWKKAVTDPETRKRFRHFVNSEAPTATSVRGGTRPDPPGHGGREEAARYSRRRRDRLNIRNHQEPGCTATNKSSTGPRLRPGRDRAQHGRGRADRRPAGAVFHVIAPGAQRASSPSATTIPMPRPPCSRGLVGNLGERIVVASPIYKHHFDLTTGRVPGRTRQLGTRLAGAHRRRQSLDRWLR
jgi:hypothetical protein